MNIERERERERVSWCFEPSQPPEDYIRAREREAGRETERDRERNRERDRERETESSNTYINTATVPVERSHPDKIENVYALTARGPCKVLTENRNPNLTGKASASCRLALPRCYCAGCCRTRDTFSQQPQHRQPATHHSA